MTTRDAIRTFIIQDLSFRGSPEELTGTYPLIDKEAIDSMGIFQIVGFIEDEFDIEVDDEELVVANFATLDAIAALVERKQAG